MRVYLVAILINCFSVHGFSQILKGKWEGSFVQENKEYPIFLEFMLNADSTYSVYSYSSGGISITKEGNKIALHDDTTTVCKVNYQRLSTDSIYLEEVKIIHPKNAFQLGLQRMYLKIIVETDKYKLTGLWNSRSGNGKISFWKSRE